MSKMLGDNGTITRTDGPFTESKELVAGFWLWQCRSREEAIGARLDNAALLNRAGVRIGERAGGVEPEREIRKQPFAGVQEPQLARFLPRHVAHDLEDDVALRAVVGHRPSLGGLRQRLEMGLHGVDLGDGGRDCAFDLGREGVRVANGQLYLAAGGRTDVTLRLRKPVECAGRRASGLPVLVSRWCRRVGRGARRDARDRTAMLRVLLVASSTS